MISLFALLSIICGTKCSQIVEVCAQVQAALPEAFVMGTTLSGTRERSLQKN